MTYEEAFYQACREIGETEDEIKYAANMMKNIMPMPQTGEIPRGTERNFIEFIKDIKSRAKKRANN